MPSMRASLGSAQGLAVKTSALGYVSPGGMVFLSAN